ncbi:MAG TPA: hypothetical protein VKF14_04655 [Candidatus Dormibacteraeota bacterium]|nr:hypothetical protein [Candidatus Dormibacteraeota bacterium]
MSTGDTIALVVVSIVLATAAALRELTLRVEHTRPPSPVCPSCEQRARHKLWCPYR